MENNDATVITRIKSSWYKRLRIINHEECAINFLLSYYYLTPLWMK